MNRNDYVSYKHDGVTYYIHKYNKTLIYNYDNFGVYHYHTTNTALPTDKSQYKTLYPLGENTSGILYHRVPYDVIYDNVNYFYRKGIIDNVRFDCYIDFSDLDIQNLFLSLHALGVGIEITTTGSNYDNLLWLTNNNIPHTLNILFFHHQFDDDYKIKRLTCLSPDAYVSNIKKIFSLYTSHINIMSVYNDSIKSESDIDAFINMCIDAKIDKFKFMVFSEDELIKNYFSQFIPHKKIICESKRKFYYCIKNLDIEVEIYSSTTHHQAESHITHDLYLCGETLKRIIE